MPNNRAWSDEQIAEGLALASATSLREAARQTGIPFGTLSRWSAKITEAQRSGTPKTESERQLGRAVEVAGEALGAAVAPIVAEKARRMAEELYGLAESARAKLVRAIADPGEVPKAEGAPKKRDPQWVRALVGVLAQSLEKAQLLAGKPTGRAAVESLVTQRQEFEVTHILKDPESRELARSLFRRTVTATPEPALNEGEPTVDLVQ